MNHLTEKATRDIERGFELTREAWQLLDIIVAEWESDAMSVQCFDLRIVARAKKAVSEHKELNSNGF